MNRYSYLIWSEFPRLVVHVHKVLIRLEPLEHDVLGREAHQNPVVILELDFVQVVLLELLIRLHGFVHLALVIVIENFIHFRFVLLRNGGLTICVCTGGFTAVRPLCTCGTVHVLLLLELRCRHHHLMVMMMVMTAERCIAHSKAFRSVASNDLRCCRCQMSPHRCLCLRCVCVCVFCGIERK